MVECKKCGSKNTRYVKSWNVKSGRSKVELHVTLYYCKDCKKSFRTSERVK